jgi:predicted nucleotidyltransferase
MILTLIFLLLIFKNWFIYPPSFYQKRIVSQIADFVEVILAKRYKPPEQLESAFRAMIDEYGVESLSMSQFITLVEKLMAENAGREPTEEEKIKKRREISDAFIDADVDGK